MRKHLIHLVCGSTGAGKTTYALGLSARLGAIRFSIDEWMTALYWMDAPQPISAPWAMERVERCNKKIWDLAAQIAARGIACVLDLGFSQFKYRSKIAQAAQAAGLGVQLHFLDVPAEERWRRVEARNADRGRSAQLKFDVTREMFDYVEGIWEPPTSEEMSALSGVRIPHGV
jgi:predicted kinase